MREKQPKEKATLDSLKIGEKLLNKRDCRLYQVHSVDKANEEAIMVSPNGYCFRYDKFNIENYFKRL